MSICCCSFAGTAACKTCRNNPDADLTNLRPDIVTTGMIINFQNEQNNRIPWDEFNPGSLYLPGELWEPVNVSCPKCGEQLQRREDIVLASNPPMRHYRCPVCGWRGEK